MDTKIMGLTLRQRLRGLGLLFFGVMGVYGLVGWLAYVFNKTLPQNTFVVVIMPLLLAFMGFSGIAKARAVTAGTPQPTTVPPPTSDAALATGAPVPARQRSQRGYFVFYNCLWTLIFIGLFGWLVTLFTTHYPAINHIFIVWLVPLAALLGFCGWPFYRIYRVLQGPAANSA